MSTPKKTMMDLARDAAAPLFGAGAAGLWRAHGAWSPGVLLMRAISMRAKMGLIAGTLALPIVLFLIHEYRVYRAENVDRNRSMALSGQMLAVAVAERDAMRLAAQALAVTTDTPALAQATGREREAYVAM